MTIHIGKTFAIAVVVVLLIGAAAAVGYKVGGDRKDVAGAVKAAQARAFERGRAQGDSEGRQVWADRENSQEEADSNIIDYLGYARRDWKDDRWYIVSVGLRGGPPDPRTVSITDRMLMSPGLAYSLCGKDNSSICYVEH